MRNMVLLGDICDFLDSKRVPVTEELRKPGPYPYYGANGQQGWIDDFIFDEPLVLLAEDGGQFGSKTKPIAYKINGRCWVNNHAHVLKPKSGCDSDYLHHILSYYDVTPFINGSTRPKLTKGNAATIPIPLPPLDEQKRIAAMLERADHLRRTHRFARTMSDTFLQSVFLKMFGDFREFPIVSVEELAKSAKNSIRTGPFGSQLLHSEFVEHGPVRVLGIDNATDNRFKWGEPRFITAEKFETLKRYRVFPDDVLITIMATLGRCAVVPPNVELAINTKHICCITLDQSRCLPIYLQSAFLNHPFVFSQLGVSERGAIMPGLNMGIIKELAIPLPPLEKQQQFAAIVQKYERMRAGQIEAERQAEHLFQTLLHRAFATS